MGDDSLIHEEVERLAQAHLALGAVDTSPDNDTASNTLSANMDIAPEIAESILSAYRGTITSAQPKEQMALVSVPSSLPADWLFRLEAPVETTTRLEQSLGLPEKSLQSISAAKTGDEGEDVECVMFVFVTEEVKQMIAQWIDKFNIGITPLFVKLAKTSQGMDADGKRAILEA